jgi:hypothetical protein
MAIKLIQPDTFTWPVKVNLPKDGGGYEVGTFDAEFKRLPRSRVEEIGKQVLSGDLSGIDAVREILVGWGGVTGDGDEVPFSESNRERLLEIPGVAVSIFNVFSEANAGAAQVKN